MDDDTTTVEGTETPTTGVGDTTEDEPEKVKGEEGVELVDHGEIGGEGDEELAGEYMEGEFVEEEIVEGEHVVKRRIRKRKKQAPVKDEEVKGEELEGEHMEGEELEGEQKEEPQPEEEMLGEEQLEEEIPPDPAAPFDFTDSKEALKEPYELRPDQLMEVEMLWELFQNYTPAYTDLDNYITEKELVYMMKSLLLMTYTPEQLIEVIEFCVRPLHPEGHITYEQFLKMVTIRQRDFQAEEELRLALQVYDPEKTGLIDKEYLRETLATEGHKMPPKQLDNLIKEVDISNDGTIGIEDVVGTMCIDLNKDDIQMLRDALNPDQARRPPDDDDI